MDRFVKRLGIERRPVVWLLAGVTLLGLSFWLGSCKQDSDVKALAKRQVELAQQQSQAEIAASRSAQLDTWRNLQTGCARSNKRSEEFNKVVSQVGVYAIIFQQQIAEGAEALENELGSPERAKTYRARLKVLQDLPDLKPVKTVDCASAYPKPKFAAPSNSGR